MSAIYSTGAYLRGVECIINGRKQWRWIVVEFNDDNYDRKGKLVSPFAYSDSQERLIEKFEDD